jgi:nucleotide-binding universal stress UspA family protein
MPHNPAPVVLPLDGSKNAENAIPMAVFFANAHEAPLHLIHILADDEYRGEADPDKATAAFQEYANGLLEGITVKAGHAATLLQGNPAKRVLEYADDAAAIVLASHGRSGVKATVIGSVADKIVRGARVPTLVVKGIGAAAELSKGPVVVGVDGSEASEQGLAAGRDLAAKAGASVTIVRAYTVPVATGAEFAYYPPDLLTSYEQGAKEYLAAIVRPEEKALLMSGSAVVSLEQAAKEQGASFVVVTSQGKGFISRLALGSTTDRLMHSDELPCPLYVVPVAESGD